MWWRVLQVGLIVAPTRAFSPAPIQWTARTGKNFVVVPKDIILPSKLTIADDPSRVTHGAVPHFAANLDNTITWNGNLCIEAGGRKPRDIVLINHCSGEQNQKWTFMPLNGGTMIQLQDSSLCIDVDDQNNVLSGAPIELRQCARVVTESWKFEEPQTPNNERRYAVDSRMLRFVVYSMMVAIGALSLGVGVWRMRLRRHPDTSALAKQRGCITPPLSSERLVPAVMAANPMLNRKVDIDVASRAVLQSFLSEMENRSSDATSHKPSKPSGALAEQAELAHTRRHFENLKVSTKKSHSFTCDPNKEDQLSDWWGTVAQEQNRFTIVETWDPLNAVGPDDYRRESVREKKAGSHSMIIGTGAQMNVDSVFSLETLEPVPSSGSKNWLENLQEAVLKDYRRARDHITWLFFGQQEPAERLVMRKSPERRPQSPAHGLTRVNVSTQVSQAAGHPGAFAWQPEAAERGEVTIAMEEEANRVSDGFPQLDVAPQASTPRSSETEKVNSTIAERSNIVDELLHAGASESFSLKRHVATTMNHANRKDAVNFPNADRGGAHKHEQLLCWYDECQVVTITADEHLPKLYQKRTKI